MKRKTKTLVIALIILTIFSGQVINPTRVGAAVDLNWDKPNGPSPFRFKIEDVLNPQMLSNVVGCTGVVNKISLSIAKLFQIKDYKKNIEKLKNKIKENKCSVTQLAASMGLSTIMNLNLQDPALKKECETLKSEDPAAYDAAMREIDIELSNQFREECLNGIAMTLAKNQLVKMTRATMNWVTSGFNGDPMYVRNINNFMDNLSNEIHLKQLDMFKDSSGNFNTIDYPYGRSFSGASIRASNSAKNAADSLKQDLTNFLKNDASVDDFSNDFSKGGWSGWLALTQRSQNNPLGFTINAVDDLAKKQATKIDETTKEIDRNEGILDQKVCKVYATSKNNSSAVGAQSVVDAKKRLDEAQKTLDNASPAEKDSAFDAWLEAQKEYESELESQNITADEEGDPQVTNSDRECEQWEVVTPGSLIKDKVSTYLNSPERQLEIADTINDALNILFGALVDKLRLNGLTSLGSGDSAFTSVSGGFGSNSLTEDNVDVNGKKVSSGYKNKDFDLTKDLGNTYYHETMKEMGTWNAKTNFTSDGQKLYISTPPFFINNEEGIAHPYYTVDIPGDTKLFRDGYNVWNKNDRAYFDGENWQNWKAGTSNPIKKRGILQIQQDYIVVVTELLRHFPGIMPKIGELDYCIPGPNPNWQTIMAEPYQILTDFAGEVQTDYTGGGFLKRKYVTIKAPMGEVYDAFRGLFSGTGLWDKVKITSFFKEIKWITSSSASPNKGKWKGDGNISRANTMIEALKNKVTNNLKLFSNQYQSKMDESYGKNSSMQKQFLEKENTSDLIENPAWLEMSSDGLKITREIINYNNDISSLKNDYVDDIVEANLNIYKLKIIGKEVSKIVKDAQDRRDAKLKELGLKAEDEISPEGKKNIADGNIKIEQGKKMSFDGRMLIKEAMLLSKGNKKLNKTLIAEESTLTAEDLAIIEKMNDDGDKMITAGNKLIKEGEKMISDGNNMTNGSIEDWTIPNACKQEEDLSYLTSVDLLIDFGGSKEERCNDGIDNDLDGIIDAMDPDCNDFYNNYYYNEFIEAGVCSIDAGADIWIPDEEEKTDNMSGIESASIPCSLRKDKNICLNDYYYSSGQGVECMWTDA